MTVPTCSGIGTFAFVGGQNANVAAAGDSGVLSGSGNQACDLGSGIGVGESNAVSSSGDTSQRAFIGGGLENTITGAASDVFIGAGYVNTVDGTATQYSFIGAGQSNSIAGGSIAAGIGAGLFNSISGSGTQAFIGGGYSNSNSANNGAIAGGQYNNVSAQWGFIGGGYANKAAGQYASVGGGLRNTASGTNSLVAGGADNIASGYASFAGGYHADADAGGSFVWSDSSSSTSTKATVANEFVARASGGVKFFSNSAMTTGVSLAAGGGSWASLSDRAVKTNVQPIDDANILEKVATMPITQWSYISEHGVRHVGPMAQDFYVAFGIGEDNKHITSIDEGGVALAAIKALHQQVADLKSQLAEVKAEVAALRPRK